MKTNSTWDSSKEAKLNELIKEKTGHIELVTHIAETLQKVVEKMVEGHKFEFNVSAGHDDWYPSQFTGQTRYTIII